VQVATIDLRAGRKAKASAAYASVCEYFSAGMALLDESDWSSRYELTLWSARQQDHELSDKLRACQGDDTMTVSRHRHVVTQPFCDIRKSYLFFS
jgi:hypothetical protein